MYAYVGCRTTEKRHARGKGISFYKIDENGNWTLQNITKILDNPSYLSFDRNKNFLYTVHGDFHEVSAFKVHADGNLEFLNTVDSQGRNPVYITPSLNNKFLFCASLQGGAVASLPIRADGSLGEAVYVEHLEGLTETGVSHAHQCLLDHTGKFLLVPTQARKIGYERVWVLRVDQETGKMTRADIQDARTYDEPRHIALSPDNKRAYLVNEKGNSVRFFNFDDTTGKLTPLQVTPSLPEDYVGQGQASAILVHPNGRFVYESNRIHESIAVYRVEEPSGFLRIEQFISCEGKTPRFITFSPDNKELVVANEDSDTIKFFAIDEKTGKLTFTGKTVATESPTSLVFK
ncbi:MAG: lactonase family protein [Acidaminococcus sp.]|jgi:6-phosphogluconolactonase (cycloisomerase 2 family)|nr:lactonase family protein [Acidaminococcus sp.]MCI2100252.1 lactonase family protein [Acidaminococcus sp.]MCI2114572.1 lactonase family protein [Acidaminococcus sp.]MCI2116549.1 lactonase family protein [Acidaminococcus sp.]